MLLVDCTHCHTTLSSTAQQCHVCGTPISGTGFASGQEERVKYVKAAILNIPALIIDEENAVEEYEDFANMLDLAGRNTEASIIRRIAMDEKRHGEDLKRVREDLQAILQLQSLRQSLRGA